MAWLYLFLAGLSEVAGVTSLKLSDGYKNKKWTLGAILSGFSSFYFLSLALLSLPIGTAYGIWTGIGAAGSVILGMLFFKESRDWKRVLFLMMIMIGAIGLKVTSGH
ncbi:DMT family transporter [Brevibacillus dissolubilis]|uniref:DMT family transporter n=1 Tax=Brevibacillus dissolubilis TaxID=1844116 RepID=UPI0011172508|nr:multidrug efflux SMR transporter [Brevibacillus dissolubilis]